MRSRLVLLIAIPTATAVALGASSIVSSWKTAASYQRVAQLATLSSNVTKLAYQLEYERDNTVWFVAMKTGPNGLLDKQLSPAAKNQLQVIRQQYVYTNKAMVAVRQGAGAIGSSFPAGVVTDAGSVLAELDFLKSVRTAALAAQASATDVINRYSTVINVLLAFEGQIALTSNDPQLTSTVSALSQISRIQEEFSIQRGLIVYSLTATKFAPNMFQALNASVANQASDSAQFQNFASAHQLDLYKVALANGSLADRVSASESTVIKYQPAHKSLSGIGIPSEEWFGNVTETVGKIRLVEETLVSEAINRAQDLRKKAIISAAAIGAAVLIVLAIALLFTVVVGRSMVRPLRRLRAGALEVAGVGLPETVRRMSEADSDNISIDVQPIDVNSFDEIGEVARAFDQVHREALRLAANEAALRGNVNAMFVNLSRRSQSLVERQIKLIDELEQGEQDPERLGNLFQMDHLATRMRRNSENLLVLAGHESARRWNQPVPLVDVLRAAVSEIEQYERVTLNVQPGIAVRGPAVNDVVHLIAELAENATSFSSADTPVNVSGHLLNSGGVLLDITDLGVGMGSEEMAHANWRLDNPPVVDVAVSRRMGLFVVARLAARHGIRVRLRPASAVGLTALVWLPDEVVVREGAARSGGMGRFPEPLTRFAIGAGAVGIEGPGSGDFAAAGHGGHPAVGAGSRRVAICRRLDRRAGGGGRADAHVRCARRGRSGRARPGARSWLGPHPGQFGMPGDPALRVGSGRGGWRLVQHRARPAFGAEHPSVPAQAATNEWSVPRELVYPRRQASTAAAWGDQPASPRRHGATSLHRQGRARPASIRPGAAASRPPPGVAIREPSRSRRGPGTRRSSRFSARRSPACAGSGSSFRSEDSHFGPTNGGVIIPPASSLGEENRLPIFEAVESDWFRRGRPSVDASGESDGPPTRAWTSPVDAGWKVAEAAVAPSSGGTTVAGLPRRVPRQTSFRVPLPKLDAGARALSGGDEGAVRQPPAWSARGARHGRHREGDGTSDVPGDG